ncbi:MAG: hypothetical protein JWR19_2911 [Pedosphaera sp.]|nr:hypothetical protein [Pedosphaera sp.]
MRVNFILFFAILFSVNGSGAAQETNCARRLFDFTPVSTNNPIVARIGGSLEIPVSEYLAYRKAEHLSTITNTLDLNQKKELLNGLIDQYLLVDEACRTGADQHPGFTSRMDYTRTIMLSDFLVAQEVEAKVKTADEYNQLLENLKNRLFDAATIDVSIGDYDKLKIAAREINATGASPSSSPKIRTLLENMSDSVLARYNGTAITVKQVLAIYAPLHAPRPPLESNDDLINLLKPLIVPELMAAEARRLGIESQPAFQNKLIENRNALLRIHMRGLIEAQANQELKAPGLDQRIQSWYQQNAEQYAVPATNGVKTIPTYAAIKKRLAGDYSVDLRDRIQAEKVRALRKAHPVEIIEAILKTS